MKRNRQVGKRTEARQRRRQILIQALYNSEGNKELENASLPNVFEDLRKFIEVKSR
jgi:hypothetical protein